MCSIEIPHTGSAGERLRVKVGVGGRRGFDCGSRRTATLGGDRLIRTPYNHFGGVKVPAEVRGNFENFENPNFLRKNVKQNIDFGTLKDII